MKTFLSILVGFALTFKAAAEDIVVATDEWEGYTSKDGQGYYIDLLKAIFPAPEYSLKFEFVPFKRSLLMLKSGKADILLGAYPDDVPAAYLTKYPTNADSISAALNKELAEKWKGLESLTNKTVVAKNAYAFDRYFKTPIKYAEKNNLNSMLQMLKKGRVDAVLDFKKDIHLVWESLELEQNFVIIDDVILENVYSAFTLKKPKLKEHYETAFLNLYESGEVQKMMLKHKLSDARAPVIKDEGKTQPPKIDGLKK
jgi:ABC-type amino acid transport substrate-binding protein